MLPCSFLARACVPLAVLSLLLFAACENASDEAAPTRPNIIFIMADDHANRAISAYDGSINTTPNIDRLAAEGALFLNSFCANSICGPSRASILTGTHSHVNGVTGNGAAWDSLHMVFPRALKKAGYQSVLFGKWHLNSKPGDEFDYYKILTGAGKQGFYTDDVWEFYDLKNDPHEVNNVYGQPQFAEEIARMKRELAALREQYGVPAWVFEPPYVSLRGIRATERPNASAPGPP